MSMNRISLFSPLSNIKPFEFISLTKNSVLLWALCFLGEDASSFCASSVEQYYSWNIGKRRAAEVILSPAFHKQSLGTQQGFLNYGAFLVIG